jgi:WD40 repeat protein
VDDLAWSNDEKYIALACNDQTVRIVEMDTSKVYELREHTGNVKTVDIATAEYGYRLISGGGDNKVCVWHRFDDSSLMDRLAPHAGAVDKIVVDPTGQLACSCSGHHDKVYWNILDGSRTRETFSDTESSDPIVSFKSKLYLDCAGCAMLVKRKQLETVVARFVGDAAITSFTFSNSDKVSPVIVGDKGGRVHFLELRGCDDFE